MGFKKPKSSIGKSKSLRPCHYMGPVATSLTPSVPKCLMRVEILEGRDLARFKLPLICICPPKTDPFITLSVTELRPYLITPPIKGTTNPKFNYLTEIPLLERDIKFRELRIGVMDAFTNCSALKGSGSLGFTTIDIKKAYESKGPHCSWYQLGEGKGGQIKIVLHFFPINDGRFNLPMFAISEDRRINQAVFILVIHRVFTTQKCRPIISIKVTGRPTERTSAGHFCNVYEFSEEFIFPIYYVGTDKVCIRVENEYGNSKAIKTASKKICGFMRRILTNVNLDREDDLHRHQDEDLSNFHMKIAESTYPITFFNGNNQVLKMHSFDGHSVKLSIIGKIYFVKSC
uniref:Extended synaptotagminlike protein 3 [Danio rerio] n=1 Tax=Lepeophtheirus salmonis TaxID=72036 RepID=A0A0K2TE12_LEPSM